MISMYRKNRDCNIDVRIFVIDVIKSPIFSSAQLVPLQSLLVLPFHLKYSPIEAFAHVAHAFYFAWLVSQATHPQASHGLVHSLPRWLVVVEQVAGKQYHVYIFVFGKHEHFVEGLPAVICADGISFAVADMRVCGDQDPDRVRRGMSCGR